MQQGLFCLLVVSLFALSIAEISWASRYGSFFRTLSAHLVYPFLRPLCKCTGHSLGGALALLASWQIQETHHLPHLACYTFGAPRPGNAPFARSYQQLVPDTWNVINDRHAFSQCLIQAATESSCAELLEISKRRPEKIVSYMLHADARSQISAPFRKISCKPLTGPARNCR